MGTNGTYMCGEHRVRCKLGSLRYTRETDETSCVNYTQIKKKLKKNSVLDVFACITFPAQINRATRQHENVTQATNLIPPIQDSALRKLPNTVY